MVIFIQLFQCILPFYSFCPHQNLAIAEFISAHNFFGNLKQAMVYIGIVQATAFISTSLPPEDNDCCFQFLSFAITLSLTKLVASYLAFPQNEASPNSFQDLLLP